MITFLYWATDIETKEEVNFADENLYEIGQVITRPDGSEVRIKDLAVEEDTNISCEEMQEVRF
jgi:hypothetical protein